MQVEEAGTRTTLAMEGLAMTGAWVDREQGLLSTIALEMGGSSDICAMLKPGEPVILMGPTGAPTEIPSGETVMLVGGGLGNAVLFSIGQAMRAAGCKVLYFAGYKRSADRYKVDQIEAAADQVVWCCDSAPGFEPGRAGDHAFVGNIVEAILDYGTGSPEIPLDTRRPHHRHRLGRHDGGGGGRPTWRAEAVSEARPCGDRLDQLAHAMHDEGDLRPVPAAACRSGDR